MIPQFFHSPTLDPQPKNLLFGFSFVGHGQGISIVIEYNIKCFHLMFLKCYHHPYPMANCKIESIDHKVDEV